MVSPGPALLPEPLRLPRGTVRGGIAVMVTGTYGYLLVLGMSVPTVVVNAVVVVVAFYFGSRATASPEPTPGEPPARRSRIVRGLLLVAFGGLTGWFVWQSRSLAGIPAELLAVLEVLGGYLLGLVVSWLIHRRAQETSFRRRLAMLFRDVSAIGALGLTGYICYTIATGQTGAFGGRGEEALSVVVTYYFGSRVIGR